MKMSLCQMIAIVCILAVGVLSMSPFPQRANASCDFYPIDECLIGQAYCYMKSDTAGRMCPGSNDAQITACEDATEEAIIACYAASFVCYHT